MLKCKYADKYQAKHPPKCDGGRGCEACKAKYAAIGRAMARKRERVGS